VGKYGTNLEGFGAFEGGVNADKGAPLVSTSSDGETALLFGPAALREIQAGVANGDFAIPPDSAGDTITDSNPLPYWTFTDVNSSGAITAAIVADSNAPAGFALQWSVAAGTLTGKSATITRNVPIIPGQAGTASIPSYYSVSYRAQYSSTGTGTADTNINLKIKYEYYDSADTDLTTTPPESSAETFTGAGTSGGGITSGTTASTLAPVNAAYAKVTITCATTGTVGGTAGTFRTHNIHNVSLLRDPLVIIIQGVTSGGGDGVVSMWNDNGTLTVNGNIAAAQGNVYFEYPTGASPRKIALAGTNSRLLAHSNPSCDVAASTSSTVSGVLITKVTAGQPSTNINGTATTDAFADALRNGGIAVDTTNNRAYFYSGGWKYAELTTPSDSRLKEEITEISGALDTLRQLMPVAFKWKRPEAHGRAEAVGDDGTRLGFIADQVATTDLKHWVETLGVDDREADLVDTREVLAVNIPQNEMEALVVQALLDIDARLKALESR
jgi:hypothetical protein